MKGNRFLSIVAGVIIGAIIGWWIYSMIGFFLLCGPIQGNFVPQGLMAIFFRASLWYGVLPGVLVGFLGGAVMPFTLPRGHMSKSIGTTSFLFVAPLAWYSQWDKLAYTSGGRIVFIVFMTLVTFIIIIPVSGHIGGLFERIREP